MDAQPDRMHMVMEARDTGQPLRGQTALVTGASSGIGEGVARALAAAGAAVVVNYIVAPDVAEDVCHRIEAIGRRAIAIKADVSKEDEVLAMFARAIDHFSTLHVVVSNAGLQRDAPFDKMTLEQWNTVMAVNVTGTFLWIRECLRPMTAQHSGAIVTIASQLARAGGRANASYITSMGAVVAR